MAPFEVIISVFIALTLAERSAALSCPCWWHDPMQFEGRPFSEVYCPEIPRCPDGARLIPDVCGCCSECSKIEGEDCGGPWYVDGHCSDGLQCISKNTNTPIKSVGGNIEEGVCLKPDSIIFTTSPSAIKTDASSPATTVQLFAVSDSTPSAVTEQILPKLVTSELITKATEKPRRSGRERKDEKQRQERKERKLRKKEERRMKKNQILVSNDIPMAKENRLE